MRLLMQRAVWPVFSAICATVLCGCDGTNRQATAGPPATVAEATKILSFAEYPLPAGTEPLPWRCASELSFESPGKAKPIFEAQRKYFLDRGWEELPNTYVSDEACNATLSKEGFIISLSVAGSSAADSGEKVRVTMCNHGNANLPGLPAPAGSKPLYGGPVTAMHVCETGADETKEACRKLLAEKGWTPYGVLGDTLVFKQNAIRLTANISEAPAQGGKITIQYSAQLMSADLPAIDGAIKVVFIDNPARLTLETAKSVDEISKFYCDALAKQGWKATTEKPIHSEEKDEQIFRNPAKDMLWLTIEPSGDDCKIKLDFKLAADVEATEKRLREKFEKEKQQGK
jgi:hypothetical protein